MQSNIIDRKSIILGDKIYNNNKIDTIVGKYKNKNIIVKKVEDEVIKKADLKNEVTILQMLNNDNKYVVKYEGCIVDEDRVVGIVTEYIKYGTLDEYLGENFENIDLNFIKRLILEICKSIKIIHKKGIFHNDIKTSNIMFVDEKYENIKLIDFGSSGSKEIYPYMGTYSAPEFNQDVYLKLYEEYVVNKEVKSIEDFFPPFYDKNDIFQLGFVIWDLFHFPQEYPYINVISKETYNDLIIMFQENEKKMEQKINKNVPSIYKKIIIGCWKHNMFERITVDEIIETLLKYDK